MKKSLFKITKMDCPAEESLIRSRLAEMEGIRHLDFDLQKRKLTVHHHQQEQVLEEALFQLQLGATLLSSEEVPETNFAENTQQRTLLWTVLAINAGFFVLEMAFGLQARSMGLVADSLDMLADAFVYGLSLLAVGQSLVRQKRVARFAGYFQIALASLGFAEVLRRFFQNVALPDFSTMIWVSGLALVANVFCLVLLQKSKSREQTHMKASMIFTANDVIINLGVILAGLLVHWLHSNLPDLVIGTLVFVLVMRGANRILKLAQ